MVTGCGVSFCARANSSTGLPKQDSRAFYVTVKEGAILEGSLLSSSSITAVKGNTYKIELNIENNGDMDSDNYNLNWFASLILYNFRINMIQVKDSRKIKN